jgi:hypothetical protein
MAVTKQAYTVGAPWLNFQLADQFRQAFIDAGLMAAWHDSFTTGSGVAGELEEHRVIRIVYDASKKYGTVFHWFVFRPSGRISYAYVHQWDAIAHVPLGTYRKERLQTSYNELGSSIFSEGSHRIFATQVLSTTTTLTRYSSSVRPNFAMFLLKGGSNFQCFFLMPPNTQFQPYIDLQVNTCGGLVAPVLSTKSGIGNLDGNLQMQAVVDFCHFFHYSDNIFAYGFSGRPTYDWGCAYAFVPGVTYSLFGAGTSDSSQNNLTAAGSFQGGDRIRNTLSTPPDVTGIALPCELAVDNADRASSSTPVFSDLPYSLYIVDRLPIDFGVVGHFSNNTMEVQDIFQVTPGLEEWEILANLNLGNSRSPSALVVARVI